MKKNMNYIKMTASILAIMIGIITLDSEALAAIYYPNGIAVEEEEDPYLHSVADMEFANLPLNVTTRFTAAGWDYVIVKKGSINKAYNATSGWAIDGFNDKVSKIYINGELRSMTVLYHEMGHFIDINRTEGPASATPEFDRIFSKEGTSLGEYGAKNRTEFFAEVVMHLYTDPTATRGKCPMAYEYVINVIKSF